MCVLNYQLLVLLLTGSGFRLWIRFRSFFHPSDLNIKTPFLCLPGIIDTFLRAFRERPESLLELFERLWKLPGSLQGSFWNVWGVERLCNLVAMGTCKGRLEAAQ